MHSHMMLLDPIRGSVTVPTEISQSSITSCCMIYLCKSGGKAFPCDVYGLHVLLEWGLFVTGSPRFFGEYASSLVALKFSPHGCILIEVFKP